ncbi:MAG TPA: HNH endonuclease [Aquihabitans sp.]|jgi:hypothetical protein|nr:HNH endonuclease [Aquihabitans sp.]
MGTQPKPDPEKFCPVCGTQMFRKRFNGRLEDRTRFLTRVNCSQSCGNTKVDVTKDAHHWRARQHRGVACEDCGTTKGLHVHHVDRDHTNNDPSNLRTLCGSCHLRLHWREDRPARMASAGGRTARRSIAGN